MSIHYAPNVRYGRVTAPDGWTQERWHQDATADAGTSHTLPGRLYVVQCEWCPDAFAAHTKAEAMSMFRKHETAMLAANPEDGKTHRTADPEAEAISTREELAAIRGRLNKATPGPWELKNYSIVRDSDGFPTIQDLWVADVDANGDDHPLIIHAPDDLSRLTNAIESVLALCKSEENDRQIAQEGSPTRLLAESVVSTAEIRAAIAAALKGAQ